MLRPSAAAGTTKGERVTPAPLASAPAEQSQWGETPQTPRPGRRTIPPPTEPPTGARRERNAAATKLRILDAGEREFAARGFAGARLREIAESAGVQPALIHHYFTDKQGLYRAVLDRALLPTSTESWSLLGSRHDLEGLLAGFIELLLRFYAANKNLLS